MIKKRCIAVSLAIMTVFFLIAYGQTDDMPLNENSDILMAKSDNMKTNSIESNKQTDEIIVQLTRHVYQDVYFQETLQYQALQPCDYIVYADLFPETGICKYRNIDIDDFSPEWSEAGLEYMQSAYLADIVLDKYIREYGGKDIKYRVEDVTVEKSENLDPKLKSCLIKFLEIEGEDVKLSVIYNEYQYSMGIVNVIIEGEDDKESDSENFNSFVKCAIEYKELLESCYPENGYRMFINPEQGQNSCHYRNISPVGSEQSIDGNDCDITDYYIADQVIDKYIRDYQGSDEIYRVELLNKEEREEGDRHILSVENDEVMLQIEYEDNSWLVDVSIHKRINLGVDFAKADSKYPEALLRAIKQIGNGNIYFQKTLQYQALQPCDFIMHIDMYPATDVYQYRNIDTSNLLTEWGEVDLEHMQSAYLADVVLDKYIREFGGKDTEYRIEWVTAERREELSRSIFYNMTFLEVYGEDVILHIMFNGYYDEMASVIVENQENKETHIDEYTAYLEYVLNYKELLYSSHTESEYWMFINFESEQESYNYRNVDPDESKKAGVCRTCGTTSYYIADQVIDKYIRDYQGSDVIYKVELLSREKLGSGEGYQYTLLAENDEVMLQIEYEDGSWFTNIKIIKK